MKKRRSQPLLIPCILLALALVVSLFFLLRARSDVKELEEALLELTEEKAATDNLNEALRKVLDILCCPQYTMHVPKRNQNTVTNLQGGYTP